MVTNPAPQDPQSSSAPPTSGSSDEQVQVTSPDPVYQVQEDQDQRENKDCGSSGAGLCDLLLETSEASWRSWSLLEILESPCSSVCSGWAVLTNLASTQLHLRTSSSSRPPLVSLLLILTLLFLCSNWTFLRPPGDSSGTLVRSLRIQEFHETSIPEILDPPDSSLLCCSGWTLCFTNLFSSGLHPRTSSCSRPPAAWAH